MFAAWRTALFALLWPAFSAVLRHAVDKDVSKSHDAEVQRVASLLDVERDLQADRKKDDTNLRELETQIVNLVHKRDSAKRDEARKDREIAFLQNQVGSQAHAEASAEVAQESSQETKADLGVDAAIASADQVVKQAETSEASVQRSEEKVDASAQAAAAQQAAAQQAAAQQAAAQQAAAEERAKQEAAASAAAAATAAAAEKKRNAEAQESREAFERRIRAEAEEKARYKIQAEQEAETRLRAEAEAKARVKIEAEQAAKAKTESESHSSEQAKSDAAYKQRQEEDRQRQEDQKKKDALADSADDSFKDFMKEEDGEDQQGDADYEDSANALAGAIGWNRQEIEHKADSAVKQLTEAIGGKKVVQSLQGMMAGVR